MTCLSLLLLGVGLPVVAASTTTTTSRFLDGASVASTKAIQHGSRGLDFSRSNIVVASDVIDKTVMHQGSPVKLVRAELAFETYSDHLALHAYKLREGKADGGCRSIDASDFDRDCFELYKCQLRVDRAMLFNDLDSDGVFSSVDSIVHDISLSHGKGLANERRQISNSGVYYQQFVQDALTTEYYMTATPTAVDGMALQPDSLEVKYTVDVTDKCKGCMLMFQLGFTSKATTNLKQNQSKVVIDGLTFGDLNEGYLAWATSMLATSFGGSVTSADVVGKLMPGVLSASGGKGGVKNTVLYDKQLFFYAAVPLDAWRISWDPVLGTTEFGAKVSDVGPVDTAASTSTSTTTTSVAADTLGLSVSSRAVGLAACRLSMLLMAVLFASC